MLARLQVKTPILLLLVLSAVAELFLLAGVVQSGVGRRIGVLMHQSSSQLCTAYLTMKVEWLNTYMHDIVFFCACGAAAVGIGFLAVLGRLQAKLAESEENGEGEEQKFPHFTLPTLYLLYLLYSLAVMLMVPAAGDYLTLILEKGQACTHSYELYWLTIGGVFVTGFLLLVGCWAYVLVLKLRLEDRFKEPVVVVVEMPKVPEQVMAEPTMGNMLDLILMEQRIKNQQEQKSELKEPLVDSLDSDDQASVEEGEKEKIACVGFSEYKRRQDAQRLREEEEEQAVQGILAMQQAQRDEIARQKAEELARQLELKKKVSSMALSPDDVDFDKIFEQSEKDEQNSPAMENSFAAPPSQGPTLEEVFYPANYVPVDEEDEQRFKKYKKKLLEKYNLKKGKQRGKRHLQNIEGGRSKRQVQRALNAHRKPPRTVEYYQNMLKSTYVSPIQEIQDSESYTSSGGEDRHSATFNFKDPEPPSFVMAVRESRDPEVPEQSLYSGEEAPSRLLFEKRAEKSPMRKKLFEEETSYLKNLSMGSVLGTLVKGVVESTHKTRLLKIKQGRDESKESAAPGKRKKNQKLIDFIRSKYT